MSEIRQYKDSTDREQVIELWRTVSGYEAAHNEPALSISKKNLQIGMTCSLSQRKGQRSVAPSWRATTDIEGGCMPLRYIQT